MSIGHSSSAYSLLVVKPSGSVSAAEHDDELPAPEVDRAQAVAEHARLAQPLQRVVDADEHAVADEGEDRRVGVQRPQPCRTTATGMSDSKSGKDQLQRDDEPDQERDDAPDAVAIANCRTLALS